MPSPTYVAIAKTVLTGNQLTITFSSVPSTYTDLCLILSARTDVVSDVWDNITIEYNGSGGTAYSQINLLSTVVTVSSNTNTARANHLGQNGVTGGGATASTFGSMEIYIPNYVGSTNKVTSITGVQETNATNARMSATAALWSNTSAINQIVIKSNSAANFVSGSRFDLYGIKNS